MNLLRIPSSLLQSKRGLSGMIASAVVLSVVLGIVLSRSDRDRSDIPTSAAETQPKQPAHTNRLAGASSPYLLQHAHNPVDWYPWGPEAFERAKKEDKPIFLSIGYSTCYWCHVMEREVFENEEIARLMNEHFICIKVDREERPDLDELYMTATQLMTGHGGWPNSVFLTPDLKPFFAGTYFGPTDQPGRPGFGTLVKQLGTAWKTKRDEIVEVSDRVADTINNALGERLASIPPVPLDGSLVERTVREIAASYDPRDGGFGLAPKFPNGFYYRFLLAVHAQRTADDDPDAATLAMVTGTLDAMAAGGIHDHVGGGFHRYATDGQWKVPHFEKMLYNQAQLAVAYLEAHKTTGEPRYADTARGIFRFVAEVFTGPEGQFYSALDAETDAVEGAYYTWTRQQIVTVLGAAEADDFLDAFELAEVPIFPGHRHPEGGTLVKRSRGAANTPEVQVMLDKLAEARRTRTLPRLEDKAIAAWNGMMIHAYARGAEILQNDAYRAAGAKAAEFVLTKMTSGDSRLLRSFRRSSQATTAHQEGFLEDYAFMIRGLLALHRVEPDDAQKAKWLSAARTLQAKADELFWDSETGGYFFTTPQADLIVRGKDLGDNATPGGNSVMAHNLIELATATGNPAYRTRAEELLRVFSGAVSLSPQSNIHMAHAVQRFLVLPHETGEAEGEDPIEFETDPSVSDSSAHVKVRASVKPSAAEPGETVTVTVALAVSEGWHINAQPSSADFLIATVVDVRPMVPGAPDVEVIETRYPKPKRLKTEGLGGGGLETIDVYSGTTPITMTIRLPNNAAPGTTLPLRVLAKFQACSDTGTCLIPAEWSDEVRVRVNGRSEPGKRQQE